MTQKKPARRPKPAAKDDRDDFFRRVYEVVARIPEGKVTTYGTIAAHLGLKSSARLVGYALNGVVGDMELPCHRVVNRNGELSGKHHFATPTLMRDLLESEDVGFDGEAVRMTDHFWDPAAQDVPVRKRAAGKATAQKNATTQKSGARAPAKPKRGKRT